MTERDRTEWVDIAKGVTITLMVFGHVTKGLVKAGLLTLTPWLARLDELLGTFRMPLFFFLAGLFIIPCLRKYGAAGLFRRRVDSLVYPYVLWTLIHSGMQSLLPGAANNRPLAWWEVLNFMVPQHHYWFLYALFFLTAIGVALFMWLPPRCQALALVLGFGVYLGREYLPHPYPFMYIYGTLCFFLLGAVARPGIDFLLRHASRIAGAGVLLFVGTASVLFHTGHDYTRHGVPALVLGLIAIPTLCALSVLICRTPFGRVLARAGAASLPIYVAHVIAAAGFRVLLGKVAGITDPTLHLIGGVAAGTIGPLLLYLLAPRLGLAFLFAPPPWLSAARPPTAPGTPDSGFFRQFRARRSSRG